MYTPGERYQHARDSAVTESSRVEVIEMQQEYFRDNRKHLCQMYAKHDKDRDGRPLQFSKVVWFNFGVGEEHENGAIVKREHPQEVWVRNTYDLSETPRKVFYYKKSRVSYCLQYPPPPQYEHYPLPIKAAKAADLKKLAIQYLPNIAKDMYIDLPVTGESDRSESEDSD